MDIGKFVNEEVHRCYWQDDINCARTVMTVLAGLGGPAVHPEVWRAAAGMHGAGGYGAQCGLVEGGLMYIGIAGAATGRPDTEVADLCREYAAGFEAAFGSLLCRELRPQGFSADDPPHLCERLTAAAALYAAGFMRDKGFIG